MELEEIKTLIEAKNSVIDDLKTQVAAAVASRTEADARLSALEAKTADGLLETADADPDAELKAAFRRWLRAPETKLEGKAFQLDAASGGQYAVPQTLLPGLGEIARDRPVISGLVGKRSASAAQYSEVLEAADGNYEWVGETDVRNITENPTIVQVTPTFGEISAIVEVSRQSLTDVHFDLEGYIIRSASRSFDLGLNAAVLTGNGVKKPTGLFAAGTEIVTEEVAQIGHDELVDLVLGTKADYRRHFVVSSLTLAILAKLKDDNGNPLYLPSLLVGVPGTLIGYPVIIDEAVEGVIFGDLERAYITVTVLSDSATSILVDPFTRKGFVRYYIYRRIGGGVRDAAAVKRLILEP